jgi:hypothetical protein
MARGTDPSGGTLYGIEGANGGDLMTYQDDPNNPDRRSYPMTKDTSYTGWIIGGIVAVAVIIAVFALMGNSTDQQGTAANPPATPTTTGSATPDALPPAASKPAPNNTVPPGQTRP